LITNEHERTNSRFRVFVKISLQASCKFVILTDMLSKEDVIKIAQLARIALTDEEVEKYQKDLSTVLEYVEELKQVNAEGLEEISQVTGLINVQRDDKPVIGDNQQEIFSQAPEMKDGFYKVKAIL
jgi:aspartyl-tRNA(Asn)/glutamyl-tRNA(Gln) amidotransferase subunit C